MQAWSAREVTRHALLFGEGPTIMDESKGAEHLVRNGAGVDPLGKRAQAIEVIDGQDLAAMARSLKST